MEGISEEKVAEQWVCEIKEMLEEEMTEWKEDFGETAWDDVNGGELDPKQVKVARKEEVGYMEKRGIWSLKPTKECWEKTGKAPVSVRWVDIWEVVEVRSRLGLGNLREETRTESLCSQQHRR